MLKKEKLQKLKLINRPALHEILGVAEGSKPAILDAMSVDEEKNIHKIFPDLYIENIGKKLNPTSSINDVPMYVISKDKKVAKDLISDFTKNGFKNINKFLGYPSCCIEHMNSQNPWSRKIIYESCKSSKKISFLTNNLFNFRGRLKPEKNALKKMTIYFQKNDQIAHLLLRLNFISHIPCSYDCKKSTVIGKETYNLLEKYYPKLCLEIRSILSKPVLFFDLFKWIVFDGKIDKDMNLHYKKIVPPVSLIDSKLIKTFSSGDNIKVNKKSIKVYKGKNLIYEYQKKDEIDGFIINFQDKIF